MNECGCSTCELQDKCETPFNGSKCLKDNQIKIEFKNIMVKDVEINSFIEGIKNRYEIHDLNGVVIVEITVKELEDIREGVHSDIDTIYNMLDDWCDGNGLGYDWVKTSIGTVLYATCEW